MMQEIESLDLEELKEFLNGNTLEYPDDNTRFWIAELQEPKGDEPSKLVRNFLKRTENGYKLEKKNYYHTQYTYNGHTKKGYIYITNTWNCEPASFANIAKHFHLPNQSKPSASYQLLKTSVQASENAKLYVVQVNKNDAPEKKIETRLWVSDQQITAKNGHEYIPDWLYFKLLIKAKEHSGLSSPQLIKSGRDNLIVEAFAKKEEE